MADKIIPSPFDPTCLIRHRDMGDGTWAPVSAGGIGGSVTSASSGNVAAATATATLAAAAGKTNYLSGFEITSAGSTAAAVVTVTITGLLGGTASYTYTTVAGATLPNAPLTVTFSPPLAASAVNTAIVLSMPSLGAGNTNATVVAHGYQV